MAVAPDCFSGRTLKARASTRTQNRRQAIGLGGRRQRPLMEPRVACIRPSAGPTAAPNPPNSKREATSGAPFTRRALRCPSASNPQGPRPTKQTQKESDGPRGAATVSADGAASRMFTAISRCCRHPQTHKQTPAAPPCPSARPAASAAAPPRPTKRPQAEGRASRRPHLTCSTMPISRSCRLCRCPRAPQPDPN